MQNQNQHVFKRRRKGANQRISVTMTPEDIIILNKLNTFMVQADPQTATSQSQNVCTALKYARNFILEHDMERDHVVKVFE